MQNAFRILKPIQKSSKCVWMFRNTGANAFAKNQTRLAYEDKRDLYCSYLKLFEIALSPPLISRHSVQNHLNYPTDPQPITDSCHNNSLPLTYLLLKTLATAIHWLPNPSSLPTSNHRLCLLFLNHWSCQRHLTLPYPITLHTNSHKTHAPL